MSDTNVEIEVRFLEIDKEKIVKKLEKLGATDQGEDFLRDIIFYDQELTWRSQTRFVRLRETKNGVFIAYKHKVETHSIETEEIEMKVADWEKAKQLLEAIGLVAYREQEKKRHTYVLRDVTVDIDTWPSIPTYVELEGFSEKALKDAAKALELDWENAVFAGPSYVIEHYYKIPVTTLRSFTFDKIE